jgi:hypothetical protein
MILNLASVIIIFLFSGGMITYFYALIEEGRSAAPHYMKLATGGALLSIAATFAAIIAGWLGLLA